MDHQEHEHAPFSPEADAAIETIDGQVGRLIDGELKENSDAKIVIVSDHSFVRVVPKVALKVLFERAGLLQVRPGAADDGTSPVVSWDAEAWESGGAAAVMIRDRNDPRPLKKVKPVLAEIASDPRLGVHRVVAGDEIARPGGSVRHRLQAGMGGFEELARTRSQEHSGRRDTWLPAGPSRTAIGSDDEVEALWQKGAIWALWICDRLRRGAGDFTVCRQAATGVVRALRNGPRRPLV